MSNESNEVLQAWADSSEADSERICATHCEHDLDEMRDGLCDLCGHYCPAEADAQREPELSNAEIARKIVDDWFPTERGKRPLIDAFVSALDAKDTRSRPTVAQIHEFTVDELEYIYLQCDVDANKVLFRRIEKKLRKLIPRYRAFDEALVANPHDPMAAVRAADEADSGPTVEAAEIWKQPSELERKFGQIVMALMQNQFDDAREIAREINVQFDTAVDSPFVRDAAPTPPEKDLGDEATGG